MMRRSIMIQLAGMRCGNEEEGYAARCMIEMSSYLHEKNGMSDNQYKTESE